MLKRTLKFGTNLLTKLNLSLSLTLNHTVYCIRWKKEVKFTAFSIFREPVKPHGKPVIFSCLIHIVHESWNVCNSNIWISWCGMYYNLIDSDVYLIIHALCSLGGIPPFTLFTFFKREFFFLSFFVFVL